MSDNWLDEIVKCPWCKNDVREGDRIWLDGEALCPDCYQHKRRKYYGDSGIYNDKYEKRKVKDEDYE